VFTRGVPAKRSAGCLAAAALVGLALLVALA
jgi:hypothetical protein